MAYFCTIKGRLYDTHAERHPYVSTIVECPACEGDSSRETWRCSDGCCVEWENCDFCLGEEEVEYAKALTHDPNIDYWPSMM